MHLPWPVVSLSLLIATLSPLTGCQDSISDRDIQPIPLVEVRRLMEKEGAKLLLVDSRLPSEFAAAHIPGAINVPVAGIDADKAKLPPEFANAKWVVVYGENPGDGYAAAITKRLLRAGQSGARLFAGGFAEWKKARLADTSDVAPIAETGTKK